MSIIRITIIVSENYMHAFVHLYVNLFNSDIISWIMYFISSSTKQGMVAVELRPRTNKLDYYIAVVIGHFHVSCFVEL